MSDDNSPKATDKIDDELSELLDSALEDFTKDETQSTTTTTQDSSNSTPTANVNSIISQTVQGLKVATNHLQGNSTNNQQPANSANTDSQSVEESTNNISSSTTTEEQDFVRQLEEQYGSQISNFLSPDGTPSEELQLKLEEMAEAALEVMNNPTVTDNSANFASIISQSIQGLSEGTDNVQSQLNEESFLNMFGGGGIAEGAGNPDNPFLPFMQGMMQSLLSKEVLYPSLKDILDRFPEWIERNREKLSADELQKHQSQINLMRRVCDELEKEQTTDSTEVKRERFEKVLDLMQQLQNYGEPPAELVGEMPVLPDMSAQNQCSLM